MTPRSAILHASAATAAMLTLAACAAPFGLGSPATRELESGAAGQLSAARSFEMKGTYTAAGVAWSIDLQLARPGVEHVRVSSPTTSLEAVIEGQDGYFRGQKFLAQHVGTDAVSQALVSAAGDSWWKGSAGFVPTLPNLTDGPTLRSTFMGPAADRRTDHVSVDGIPAVELSGPRGDVYIASAPPFELLRLRMAAGVVVDGFASADLRYSNYNVDFHIASPATVIDFSNLSTLPPVYTIVSVDTSGCASPCVVAAVVKNIGGLVAAFSPSTVTFTMTDPASGQVLGSCQALVVPDVGYNSTATVTCTITLSAQPPNAATVTAAATNPGRPTG